jgi:predicted esterase
MAKVQDIQAAIESLPEAEYAHLRRWFSERDWVKWDRQIEVDAASGKLDSLVNEAIEEKRKGKLKAL